ncbi:hypothetical protein F0562_034267 [Nyssa sinensis]|uniref:Uncharacterized protein n=1 Tax=Nyssa sinensis TaxID=561372 RepID=A0A5J5AF73_9ASTE|nr:hypothetical protein F0562_034267 [Nyssa sinensis]
MSDERISRLEVEVGQLSSAQEKRRQEIQDWFVAMNARFDQLLVQKKFEQGENSIGQSGAKKETSSNRYVIPKFTKLEFPKYRGGEDPTSWEGLHARFGPTKFEDFFGDLTKLRQSTTVRDYQTQFEKLLARAGKLTPAQHVSCFISGLKESIRIEVQASRPTTLSAVVGLARLYEAKLTTASKRSTPLMEVRRPFSTVPDGSRPTIPTIRKFSLAEIEERRKQGLCFHCNDKYKPRHLCKKLFILEACYPDDVVEDCGETIEFDEEAAMENIDEAPAISLHAISGTHTPQTMKVRGTLGKYRVIVLLDSSSTHNFLKEDVASKLALLPDKNGQLDVKVASGERLSNQGKCKGVELYLQGVTITVDCYLLPLDGYEVVLGAQWLRTLGPLLWDFSKLQMQFQLKGQTIIWQGLSPSINKIVGEAAIRRDICKKKEGILLQLNSLDAQPLSHIIMDTRLQPLLEEYHDIFEEPSGLPPRRAHDHKIPLLLGSSPICVRPYR